MSSMASSTDTTWVGKKPLRRIGGMSDALSIAADLGFSVSPPPTQAAEAYALRKAVVVALEESLSLVIVESDAQALILGVKTVSKLLSWDRFTNYD